MEKLKLKCQIAAFSLMLLIGAVFTASEASAQGTDGFFSECEQISNGDNSGYTNSGTNWDPIVTNDPTEADLDDGLLLLLAAGTSYLLIRRKQKSLTKFKSVEK